jgi:hypothetical protein
MNSVRRGLAIIARPRIGFGKLRHYPEAAKIDKKADAVLNKP